MKKTRIAAIACMAALLLSAVLVGILSDHSVNTPQAAAAMPPVALQTDEPTILLSPAYVSDRTFTMEDGSNVIVYNDNGVGGGVCSVSGSLYNAALNSVTYICDEGDGGGVCSVSGTIYDAALHDVTYTYNRTDGVVTYDFNLPSDESNVIYVTED